MLKLQPCVCVLVCCCLLSRFLSSGRLTTHFVSFAVASTSGMNSKGANPAQPKRHGRQLLTVHGHARVNNLMTVNIRGSNNAIVLPAAETSGGMLNVQIQQVPASTSRLAAVRATTGNPAKAAVRPPAAVASAVAPTPTACAAATAAMYTESTLQEEAGPRPGRKRQHLAAAREGLDAGQGFMRLKAHKQIRLYKTSAAILCDRYRIRRNRRGLGPALPWWWWLGQRA